MRFLGLDGSAVFALGFVAEATRFDTRARIVKGKGLLSLRRLPHPVAQQWMATMELALRVSIISLPTSSSKVPLAGGRGHCHNRLLQETRLSTGRQEGLWRLGDGPDVRGS